MVGEIGEGQGDVLGQVLFLVWLVWCQGCEQGGEQQEVGDQGDVDVDGYYLVEIDYWLDVVDYQ